MSVRNPQPPVPLPPAEKVRSFLGWAFVISLGIHLLFGPFIRFQTVRQDKPDVEKVSVTKKIKVVVPTPPPPSPTPPPPTPEPKSTPPPVTSTNPPPQPKLKLNVQKVTSKDAPGTSSEHQYVQPKQGSENGVPQGTVNSAPPAPANTNPPGPPPAPTPTPRPACAQPHKDAETTMKADLDYPDMARQQGATGTAQVKVSLSETGAVLATSIYKSAGNPLLDQSAIKAARNSRYSPEVDNCQAIAGTYLFTATFDSQ